MGVCALALVTLCGIGPIPQDPGYHLFADARAFDGISNFWNVASNLPFVVVGLYGLWRYPRLTTGDSRVGYLVLCMGVCFVGVGSAYYHLAPSNASLLWDRLPMTVAFMALLALLLGERVLNAHKQLTLWLLVAVGISAAIYWSWTEARGQGDLRPYGLVQFLPLVLIPLILLLYPARYIRSAWLLYAFALYVLAKLFEHFDHEIYLATGAVSGHTLKHLAAALAALCIIAAIPAARGEPARR